MTDKKDGGPSFPSEKHDADGPYGFMPGMSLRDYFAGQALAGMHARDSYDNGQATPEQRAKLAYIDADAMLAARENRSDD